MIWQEWFILQKCRWMTLWNQFNQLRYLILLIVAIDFFLREREYEIPLWIFGLGIITYILIHWIASIFWDKAHLIHYEADFNNKRNPLLMKQVDELTKIRKLLEKFK